MNETQIDWFGRISKVTIKRHWLLWHVYLDGHFIDAFLTKRKALRYLLKVHKSFQEIRLSY
jgi:hypothetical protein